MKKTPLFALLGASLLTACGGGSDSSSTPTDTPTTPPSTTASVSLSGTAAKGLMANADVKVHPVAADGTVDLATVLTSATTGSDGRYTLTFEGTKDKPYVVRVTAKVGTTHLDEVTGQAEPLPVGFAMRTIVTPSSTGSQTTSASITPFSEMAVAAAAKATGGLNAANTAQAVSTVTQLLGFDPIKVTATTTGAAESDDEKKLAVMLTAVAQMASSGDLGCTGDDNGAKVKCVVEKLGEAAKTDSIKLERSGDDSANGNVSAVLGNAVNTVLAKPELVGAISGSLLTTVTANLACTSNCTAATTGSPTAPDALTLAITGAKLMFAQLKSDWTALFSRGGATSVATGAANVQAFKFDAAMRDADVPLATMVNDLGAMLTGIDLYNDYKAGRTLSPTRVRAPGVVPNDGSSNFDQFNATGCGVYQDSATQVLATDAANANFIGCSARFYVTRTVEDGVGITNEWRHGFTITPQDDGSFGWQTRARLRKIGPNGTVLSNAALQLDAAGNPIEPFTGTVTPTLTGGSITGISVSGELPGGFAQDGNTLVSHKHTITASGTRTISAANRHEQVSNLTGTLVAMDASGATLSTLRVKEGVLKSQPISQDANGNAVAPTAATAVRTWGGELSAVTLNLVFTTPQAELEAVLSMPSSSWDKTGTSLQPTELRVSGMLRNISNGVTNEFLKGTFTAKSSGYDSFDATLAYSATNSFTRSLSFVGEVTAPSRPLLALSLGAEQRMDRSDGTTQSMTMQYRSIVNGTPRLVVNVAGTRDASTGATRLQLTEASANLSMAWQDGAANAELLQGDRLVGSVNTKSGVVSFADGSLVSLDVGL
jgi:hypothetical protein